MEKIALVVGSSGISGNNLTTELLEHGWETYALSRGRNKDVEGAISLKADLLDVENLKEVLKDIHPTHVFFTTWMRKNTEEENIQVNRTMVRNLLDVVSKNKSVKYVGLVTGLKHYLGPFDAYAKTGVLPETPVREEHPRLDAPNFYYAQEDEVYAAADRDGFNWAIHRPHTLIGNAIGNQMNMGATIAVYASICKEKNLPFIFPGSEAQWNGISDVTDAKILAKQVVWAAETPAAYNKPFNTVNGDVFRWSWLWKKIAEWFSVDYEGFENEIRPLEKIFEGKESIWRDMVKKYGLKEEDLQKVSSAWFADLDLGRPIEVMTDMSNSRELGFKEFYNTKDSFFSLFEKLRSDKIIP